MDEALLAAVRFRAAERSPEFPFPPALEEDLAAEEKELGFPIPVPLRAVYRLVGNGGFGPGRGGTVIGVRGGYRSDFGTLAETHAQIRGDTELELEKWPAGLLPFCEWGCNIFTCVGRSEDRYPLYWFESGEMGPCGHTLEDFFRRWASGDDVFALHPATYVEIEGINPFTRESMRLRSRRPG